MSGRNNRQRRQRTSIPNQQGYSNQPPEAWIPTGRAPSPLVFERAERSRTTNADRGRTPGGPSGVHQRGHPIEPRETWLPSGRPPSPLVFEQPERTERRAPQHTFPTPVPPLRDPGIHTLFEEPRAPWAHAGADIPIRPRSPLIPGPEFGARQPEYTRAPHPTPTFVYPGPPSPEPVRVPPQKPRTRRSPSPPVVVQPPRPRPEFITVQPAQVPHPAPSAPRPILRRDSAGPRQRRPSESGTTPVVRIVPPQTFNERPAAHYIPDEEGQPRHRLPHWTLPDRFEAEPLADAQSWSGHQPYEPSWYRTGGWPHESQDGNRSGRHRRGSQSSAQPYGVRSPPYVRSPPQEREHRQSSTFVSNDPFKVQTPLQRRKHEASHGKNDVSLNFDSIPLPGERTPTDTHSPAEEIVVEPPTDAEEKIGNQAPSEYGSQHSGANSKSSSKKSILSSTPIGQITNYVIPVVPFIFTTLLGQAYVLVMLRLPLLYFTRVARIFEEADLSVGDLKHMALEAGSKDRGWSSSNYELEQIEETPRYKSLKKTWSDFIDSVMQEWNTLNIISVLLLSAILTILQIQAAAVDPITRYTALSSLLCALMSLLYGCTYIIRFGTMRKTYKAFEWALEAKRNQRLWWNVWVMLAMPAIWLTWSIILYIACIMSFIWRTSPEDDGSEPIPLSPELLLIIRVVLSSVLGIGVFYSLLILTTFRRYGLAMDHTWQKRIDEWIERKDAQY